jgi:ribose transport system substrate-binding protein
MFQTHHVRGRQFVTAAVVAAGLFIAACGSDSNSDSNSGNSTAATTAATTASAGGETTTAASGGATTTAASGGGDAAAVVAQYTQVPTEIVQTEALSKKPDAKKVTFIVCADPSCVVLADFLKEATTALGWSFSSINAPATDFGSAIQQAIDTKPDFIAGTGTDAAAFQPQYDAMKAAGIPYFTCYATDVPKGEDNNLYADCYDASAAEQYSKVLVDWIINDSGGKANTLIVNLPAFPILSAQADGAKKEFETCSGCTTKELDLTLDDLTSGAVANSVVSFLQSNPDINYLYLTYNGFEPGLSEALASAGMSDKVKVAGTQGTQPQLQAIIDGKEAVWTALPQEYAMWSLADQMARVANGEWSSENERTNAVPPFFLVDTVESAKSIVDLDNGWPGPDGFKDAFKQLWGVS